MGVKIVQPVSIETRVKGDIMAVRIPKELLVFAEADFNFFLDLKQVESLGIKSLDLEALRGDTRLRRYFYFDGDIHKLSRGLGATGRVEQDKFWEDHSGYADRNSLKILREKGFDQKNLVFLWSEANLFFRFRGEMPITRPYFIHYIGGVTNSDYDLDKAEKLLKANRWVSEVEHHNIPYYNRDEGRSKALHFVVRLPQKEYDKLVRYYRDEKKEEFWTVRLKDSLSAAWCLDDHDVLGLKAALKAKK
jgi:hypothetical protein